MVVKAVIILLDPRKRPPYRKGKNMEPETLKTLLAMLMPIIDGIVQKTKTPLDNMAWEVIKALLAAHGPEIATALHKELVAKGMATP